MNPTLIAQPYAHWMADILERFEDGKPLTNDQLNFLWKHEKTLSNHALDMVIKYYLSSHHNDPNKHLAFTMPKGKINSVNAHEVRDAIENLLKYDLSHVDLQMSADQFLQFKAVGFHELIFWHGPQFLSRTLAFPSATPLVLYFQWNKLFGVVKLNTHEDHLILDGNVLIYFEDMDLRSLNQCILDYTKTKKIDYTPSLQKNYELETPEQHLSFSPRPKFYALPAVDPTKV